MIQQKAISKSRTVISALVGLLVVLATLFGFEFDSKELIVGLETTTATLITIYYRVVATKKIKQL